MEVIEEKFYYDYYFGYVLYFKVFDKRFNKFYDETNIVSYYKHLYSRFLDFLTKIDEFNGEEICDVSNFKWRHCVKFDNEEDCKKCVEYLNGLLMMNKLLE